MSVAATCRKKRVRELVFSFGSGLESLRDEELGVVDEHRPDDDCGDRWIDGRQILQVLGVHKVDPARLQPDSYDPSIRRNFSRRNLRPPVIDKAQLSEPAR